MDAPNLQACTHISREFLIRRYLARKSLDLLGPDYSILECDFPPCSVPAASGEPEFRFPRPPKSDILGFLPFIE
jgi:hypothetical protein